MLITFAIKFKDLTVIHKTLHNLILTCFTSFILHHSPLLLISLDTQIVFQFRAFAHTILFPCVEPAPPSPAVNSFFNFSLSGAFSEKPSLDFL